MPQHSEQRAPAARPATSQTTTIPNASTDSPSASVQPARILRLRGARTSAERSVQWAEGVVDNEGLGRKSSKVCCIYHKPKAVDESSDESSSSDSDVSTDDDSAMDADRKGKGRACGHNHEGKRSRKSHRDGGHQKRQPSPNAYEKVPKPRSKEPKPEEKTPSK